MHDDIYTRAYSLPLAAGASSATASLVCCVFHHRRPAARIDIIDVARSMYATRARVHFVMCVGGLCGNMFVVCVCVMLCSARVSCVECVCDSTSARTADTATASTAQQQQQQQEAYVLHAHVSRMLRAAYHPITTSNDDDNDDNDSPCNERIRAQRSANRRRINSIYSLRGERHIMHMLCILKPNAHNTDTIVYMYIMDVCSVCIYCICLCICTIDYTIEDEHCVCFSVRCIACERASKRASKRLYLDYVIVSYTYMML